jgi:hypothetical protein
VLKIFLKNVIRDAVTYTELSCTLSMRSSAKAAPSTASAAVRSRSVSIAARDLRFGGYDGSVL